MLMESEDLVKRENPSICAVGDGKVAVFGGYHNVDTLTDGYIFDEESKQVTKIMGGEQDFGLQSYTPTIKLSKLRYMTFGKGPDKLKLNLVEFIYNSGSPAESEARSKAEYDAVMPRAKLLSQATKAVGKGVEASAATSAIAAEPAAGEETGEAAAQEQEQSSNPEGQ